MALARLHTAGAAATGINYGVFSGGLIAGRAPGGNLGAALKFDRNWRDVAAECDVTKEK